TRGARSCPAQRHRGGNLRRRPDAAPVRRSIPPRLDRESCGVGGYHSHAGTARSGAGPERETRRRSLIAKEMTMSAKRVSALILFLAAAVPAAAQPPAGP